MIQEAIVAISIFINPDIVSLLEHHYDNMEVEYGFCLIASARNGHAFVDRLGTLEIIRASHDTVTVGYQKYPCDQYTNVIGMIHPHLAAGQCGMSAEDFKTWRRTPFSYNFVQCGSRTWTMFGNQERPRRTVFIIHEDNSIEWLVGGPNRAPPNEEVDNGHSYLGQLSK